MKLTRRYPRFIFSILLSAVFALMVVITAYAAWNAPVTVHNSSNNVGTFNSMVVVDGNPAISYYDATIDDLMYVRAANADGTSWGTPVTVDSTGNVGEDTSMAIVNGYPAIAYYDNSNDDLKYVRANNASGSTWGTPVTVDSSGSDRVGEYTSLVVVNGNPAISYHDTTNNTLEYVRATNANGTSWGTPVTVDTGGDVGRDTSMAIVNGNPAISYDDPGNDDLKYVRASNVNGSSWGTPVTVDSGGDVGQATSLTVVNGNPAISYFDNTNDNLKYVRATNANGSSWGTPATVDNGGGNNVGTHTSLLVVSGNPAIAYYDATTDDLKYTRASDANGATWNAPSPGVLDSGGDVGRNTSMAIVNNYPAVSYFDNTNDNLKFIRATTPTAVTLTKFESGTGVGTGTQFIVLAIMLTLGGLLLLRRVRHHL